MKYAWLTIRLWFGVCIKILLVIPIMIVAALAKGVYYLDTFIRYLWSTADSMIEDAITGYIYGE